jgi:hypothetical protein
MSILNANESNFHTVNSSLTPNNYFLNSRLDATKNCFELEGKKRFTKDAPTCAVALDGDQTLRRYQNGIIQLKVN